MAQPNSTISPYWEYIWEDLCGPEGLQIWSAERHDLGLCFQNFCFFIPVLMLLAVSSAYYFGTHVNYVIRCRTQLYAINGRCLIVLLLTLMPLLKIYIALSKNDSPIEKIFYLLAAMEGITWFTHLGFLLALRNRLGLSSRGPVFICVLWTTILVLSIISFRSHNLIFQHSVNPNFSVFYSYAFSVVGVILQVFYGFTMIPGVGATTLSQFENAYAQIGENSPLLASAAYSRFLEEQDPNYLGVAMEDTTWLSKLLFYWVNPLMQKGVDGKIANPDDLFDLPDPLSCQMLSQKFDKALRGNVDDVQKKRISQGAVEATEVGNASTAGDTIRTGGPGLTSTYGGTGTTGGPLPTTLPEVQFKIRKHNISLIKALHKCFWLQFYSIGILKLIGDCSGFAGPMLLNKLVGFIEDRSEDIHLGYLYAFGLFLTTLICAFCNSHFNFFMAVVGIKIRAAIVTTIYRKTLTVGGTVLNSAFSVGEIVNFMSTDTDRVVNSCPSFHALWSIPFQLGVTLYLLYSQVGLAFLAGVGFSIILIPINKLIANKIGSLSTKMMERKDERVKLMTEVLRGIRNIKIHVWDSYFIKLITKMRDGELKYLKGRKYLDALCVYFWATTPVLISILTFGTYVLMGNKLTAATVFTSIALLNMLISPLNAFPWVLNGLTEAWVSIKRIQKLLDLPDLDLDEYYDISALDPSSSFELFIKEGEFNWGKSLTPEERSKLHASRRRPIKDKGKGKKSKDTGRASRDLSRSSPSPIYEETGEFYLSEIDFFVKKGELVGIMGNVGCGKSSVLSAVLAELTKQNGVVAVNDLEKGFGYVSQQPWLQRGSIRDNILFGKTYDESRYRTVLDACCLTEDLLLLPAGDLTGVGEGGMTLSGGQKARVALARAVYQDKPVYLFDDILSAVDVKVAKHIFQHCIMGMLRNKTRVICTHHVQYLVHADRVVLMENGRIKDQGKPSTILSDIDDFIPIDLELGDSLRSTNTLSLDSNQGSVVVEESQDNDSILNEEGRETGTVQFNVYGSYWKSVGHLLSVCVLISMILMQTSRNMTDWWLSYWVTNAGEVNKTTNGVNGSLYFMGHSGVGGNIGTNQIRENGLEDDHGLVLWFTNEFFIRNNSIKYYMMVYGILAGLNSIFTLFRAFLFAYGGIAAASRIHKFLLRSIMNSKITFFDISPLGRILNRFSSDTYTIDDSLPFILNILLAQFFGLIGCVVVVVYGLPWLCLVLVPLIPVYHWLQNNYRLTSRELKRLSSVTLSPVYSHFNESLQGLATIRAFRTTQRFCRDNEENVEVNQKAQFAAQAAAQWLGLRLQFIGVAMVTGVGLIAVVQHEFDVADPGLVGLAISYALSITGLLSGVVNAFTETEREMIAVERVNQYIDEVEPEPTYFVTDPPYAWPSQGVITFNKVILKYREHLTPSLKGVSFETRPAEKIGVVGRTGAGKSSLFAGLFRMVELYSGAISIDSVNIAHISITALRLRLSCIPQDPFLFSGTVRENLDPLQEYRDQEIWGALTRVDLTPTIKRIGGLDYQISSGGLNLSVGQRQLFCLARALLRNSKILCIDEATANVDQETDRQIQHTLRSAFRKSTVITIAHRVQTVLDCDRVIVMGDGQVLEFDSPESLLADPTSLFYQLVNNE